MIGANTRPVAAVASVNSARRGHINGHVDAHAQGLENWGHLASALGLAVWTAYATYGHPYATTAPSPLDKEGGGGTCIFNSVSSRDTSRSVSRIPRTTCTTCTIYTAIRFLDTDVSQGKSTEIID